MTCANAWKAAESECGVCGMRELSLVALRSCNEKLSNNALVSIYYCAEKHCHFERPHATWSPLFFRDKHGAAVPHADSTQSIFRAVGAFTCLQYKTQSGIGNCSGCAAGNHVAEVVQPVKRTFLPVLGTTKYLPGSWQHFALRPSRHGPADNWHASAERSQRCFRTNTVVSKTNRAGTLTHRAHHGVCLPACEQMVGNSTSQYIKSLMKQHGGSG